MNNGDRLKEERLRLNLSQEAFGKLGGVAKIAQFNYEKNKRMPDISYLEKLYQEGVDVFYIITGSRVEFSNDELELIELFRKTSLKKKLKVIQLLTDKDD